MKKQTFNFKSGDKYYEFFIAKDDNQIEVYEKYNPKEGLIFKNKNQFIGFINSVSDIFEGVCDGNN